jgi:hypothetical protein
MGWGKRLRKAVKRIGGKSVMKVVKPVKAFFKGPKETPEAADDTGARGAAASRLIKASQRQAGGGQISFNTEEQV